MDFGKGRLSSQGDRMSQHSAARCGPRRADHATNLIEEREVSTAIGGGRTWQGREGILGDQKGVKRAIRASTKKAEDGLSDIRKLKSGSQRGQKYREKGKKGSFGVYANRRGKPQNRVFRSLLGSDQDL